MKNALTPKDLALAIGVSESSLRRWIDSGAIETFRTMGGHRRIPLEAGLRFVRSSGATVVRPELLGISAEGLNLQDREQVADRLFEALRDGDAGRAMQITLSLFTAGESVAAIFDGPVRSAMHRVGELWQHDRHGILEEHRATDLCLRVLHQLRHSLALPSADAPLALGGAPEGDMYAIPSLMADAVLTETGFRTINFGPNTPADLLADAADDHNAALVWVSASVELPREQFRTSAARLARRLGDSNRMLVLGGRHAHDAGLANLANVLIASTMGELAALGKGIVSSLRLAAQQETPPDDSAA